jgi:hypothetical protein
MDDQKRERLHRVFLLLSILAIALIFFAVTLHFYDNTDAVFVKPSSLEIPETVDGYTVTRIYKSAFAYQTSLKKVTIPSTVQSIDEYAFSGCTNLKTVTFSEGLISIGYYAFESCSYLRTADLPSTLEEIGEGAFQNCTRLQALTIPAACRSIGLDAFMGCENLVLDVSQNEMAAEYAEIYALSTDFARTNRALYRKVTLYFLAGVAIFLLLLFLIRLACKKRGANSKISNIP